MRLSLMAASHLILGFHPYPLAGLRPNVRCKVPSGFRRPARGWHVAVACESHELNADNYYPADVLRLLRLTNGAAAVGFTRDGLLRGGNVPAERIAAYALLDVAPDGTVRRVIEKPDDASFARLAAGMPVSMNVWRLTSEFFQACRDVQPSPRGELELPLAVQYAIDVLGMRFYVVPADAAVLDLSRRSDIPRVAALLAGFDVAP